MTVGRVVKSGAVAVAFSMGFSILARAQGWEHRLGSRGLQQSVLTWTGLTPDGPVSTSLVLSCLAHPERGREGIGVSYVIHNFRDIKNFDFFYFSGPDAPGQFRALGAITVRTSGGRAIIFRRRVEGEYSLDNPSTDFEFDAEGLDGLVALLARGAVKVSWRIRDGRRPDRTLYTNFPTEGAKLAIDGLIKLGCVIHRPKAKRSR